MSPAAFFSTPRELMVCQASSVMSCDAPTANAPATNKAGTIMIIMRLILHPPSLPAHFRVPNRMFHHHQVKTLGARSKCSASSPSYEESGFYFNRTIFLWSTNSPAIIWQKYTPLERPDASRTLR